MSQYIPKNLGKKLAAIREKLGVETYEKMVDKLDVGDMPIYRSTIYEYEKNRRQPPLVILLRYARLGKISVDTLIDDDKEWPQR
jgi:transcriptional regulator with XRE-family HTH domain